MDEEKLQKFVEAYLKKKGLKLTEHALQEELQQSTTNSSSSPVSQFDPDVVRQILAFSEFEDGPARYQDGYAKLRSWTYTSLDLYRHELLRVLYPVFIHCFMDLVAKGHIQEARTFFNSFREDHEMMHLRDLQKLEGVLSPSHLEEMEFAHSLRQSKVNIKICQYSYELLLQFLHKSQSTTMLGIINEHINFQVSPGQPSSITDDAEAVTLTGGSQESANQINQKEIHWGLLEDSLEERLEKAGGMALDSEKAEGETKEGEGDENKKKSIEGGKQGASIKKQKKDKAVSATVKSARPEATTVPTAPRVKPELTLPVIPTEVEQSILEDLRNRVQLSSAALPSVSFYTFINTHNGLNCSSISHDGSLVAGGFSDSSLKVWDMAKIGQQSVGSILQGENGTTSSELVAGSNGGKRPYTLFQGHSGPVYSATFNPLGDFILSSSADSTIRLWSTNLNANLVCYKGHNYPVWDVQFSPVGHYFASASHDRTARIWTMDRIQPLRIMAGHLSDVDCVQWHSNCNYIATGSSDKTVRLWDVQSGECVRIFIGHRSMILSLAMSPDGRYMASGDEDGSIMMWDLSSGRCVTPLMGHTSCVWTLAFSGEGSLLASGSADCTVKLWDVTASTKLPKAEEKSGSASRLRSLKTLPTKCTPVYSLRFSRRNLLFAAGVLSKTVEVHSLQT
ncbi:transcription initiation factor TFIID subunit 5 [Rosa rugosa]|uniref:transcription initiation factor TFIID subunit 5 n=1 Tax=Rosa rugosa TaxID=74645 RepID=UPI002B407E1F|nr:transcription initiation factor TFIID subunit 5 [Rosa rugosa]